MSNSECSNHVSFYSNYLRESCDGANDRLDQSDSETSVQGKCNPSRAGQINKPLSSINHSEQNYRGCRAHCRAAAPTLNPPIAQVDQSVVTTSHLSLYLTKTCSGSTEAEQNMTAGRIGSSDDGGMDYFVEDSDSRYAVVTEQTEKPSVDAISDRERHLELLSKGITPIPQRDNVRRSSATVSFVTCHTYRSNKSITCTCEQPTESPVQKSKAITRQNAVGEGGALTSKVFTLSAETDMTEERGRERILGQNSADVIPVPESKVLTNHNATDKGGLPVSKVLTLSTEAEKLEKTQNEGIQCTGSQQNQNKVAKNQGVKKAVDSASFEWQIDKDSNNNNNNAQSTARNKSFGRNGNAWTEVIKTIDGNGQLREQSANWTAANYACFKPLNTVKQTHSQSNIPALPRVHKSPSTSLKAVCSCTAIQSTKAAEKQSDIPSSSGVHKSSLDSLKVGNSSSNPGYSATATDKQSAHKTVQSTKAVEKQSDLPASLRVCNPSTGYLEEGNSSSKSLHATKTTEKQSDSSGNSHSKMVQQDKPFGKVHARDPESESRNVESIQHPSEQEGVSPKVYDSDIIILKEISRNKIPDPSEIIIIEDSSEEETPKSNTKGQCTKSRERSTSSRGQRHHEKRKRSRSPVFGSHSSKRNRRMNSPVDRRLSVDLNKVKKERSPTRSSGRRGRGQGYDTDSSNIKGVKGNNIKNKHGSSPVTGGLTVVKKIKNQLSPTRSRSEKPILQDNIESNEVQYIRSYNVKQRHVNSPVKRKLPVDVDKIKRESSPNSSSRRSRWQDHLNTLSKNGSDTKHVHVSSPVEKDKKKRESSPRGSRSSKSRRKDNIPGYCKDVQCSKNNDTKHSHVKSPAERRFSIGKERKEKETSPRESIGKQLSCRLQGRMHADSEDVQYIKSNDIKHWIPSSPWKRGLPVDSGMIKKGSPAKKKKKKKSKKKPKTEVVVINSWAVNELPSIVSIKTEAGLDLKVTATDTNVTSTVSQASDKHDTNVAVKIQAIKVY